MNTRQKIIIVTHEMFYGVPHALRDYLLNNHIDTLVFIGLPLVEQRVASFTFYRKGHISSQKRLVQNFTGIINYILDFSLTFYWIVAQREKYSLFIAVDVLNCASALLFKKLSITHKVIFYALDFSPIRFKNSLLNYIYHTLEKMCVKNADEVWNVSPKIAEGRETFLHISAQKYPQKVVHSGVWNNKIKKFPFTKVKKHQLLFLGHLLKKQGLQMVLEAMPLVILQIPDFKFVILGGGEYETSLKKLALELKIQKYIEFKGWVKDRTVIDTTLGESAAAVAVYVPEKEKLYNFSYYADPIKIKEYLASGLPVILTNVPYNAREIEKRKCGVVVEYNKEAIASAIIFLLNSKTNLKKFRDNAILFAQEFDWNTIFSKVISYG